MTSKRLQQESFRKRRNNFIRRGNEISDRYNVDVWICIFRNGQYYIYNSNPSKQDWPPTMAQLVRFYVPQLGKSNKLGKIVPSANYKE
jgi:hypothetical protein